MAKYALGQLVRIKSCEQELNRHLVGKTGRILRFKEGCRWMTSKGIASGTGYKVTDCPQAEPKDGWWTEDQLEPVDPPETTPEAILAMKGLPDRDCPLPIVEHNSEVLEVIER